MYGPFLRSLNGILLLDIKQSQFFCLSCFCKAAQHSQKFAYFGVSAKLHLGESGHSSISR